MYWRQVFTKCIKSSQVVILNLTMSTGKVQSHADRIPSFVNMFIILEFWVWTKRCWWENFIMLLPRVLGVFSGKWGHTPGYRVLAGRVCSKPWFAQNQPGSDQIDKLSTSPSPLLNNIEYSYHKSSHNVVNITHNVKGWPSITQDLKTITDTQ